MGGCQKGKFYGTVHVIIARNNVNGKLWAMREALPLQSSSTTPSYRSYPQRGWKQSFRCANALRDEKTTLQSFAEYGLRFDIEENFLDDQSADWNVHRIT